MGWQPRSVGVVVAALFVLTGAARLPRSWWGGAVAVPLVTVLAWQRPEWQQAVAGVVMGLGMATMGELVGRHASKGAWGVVGVAGMVGAVLTAFTGSVRLAAETAAAALPALVLVGRPLDVVAGRAVGLVLGLAWAQGVLWSELDGWVMVPLACLLALRLGARDHRWAGAQAVGGAALIGAVGSAPVVVDWWRDPPF